MLCAVGDLVEDVVVWLSGPPRSGTDVDARVFRARGGSAANVAVFSAGLAGRARFAGQVGADALGDRLLGALAGAGVDAAVVRGGRTGSIVVLVSPDGERTFLTDRGASTELVTAEPGWLDGVSVLHIPAYSLAVQPLANATTTLAAEATRRGIRVSVDTSSVAALEAVGRQEFLAKCARLGPEVLFTNADEARWLGIERIGPTGVGLTVVKHGGEPTVLLAAGGGAQFAPVPAVGEVRDTTGAGDAFAAGFLHALGAGAAPLDAAVAGHHLAAKVLGQPGAVRA